MSRSSTTGGPGSSRNWGSRERSPRPLPITSTGTRSPRSSAAAARPGWPCRSSCNGAARAIQRPTRGAVQTVQTEPLLQLLPVDLRIVAITVVEQDVGELSPGGQVPDLGRPFSQLTVAIAIAEPLVDVLAVPFIRMTVHADHGQVAGGGQDRGNGAGIALGHIDAHVRELMRS